eukprot:scaffold416_cov105-Isochrysis_galbana.AAC.2
MVGRVGSETDEGAYAGQLDGRARRRLDQPARLAARRPARHNVEEELDLLGHRQHQRPEVGDVPLERITGDLHDLLGEADAPDAVGVLLLVDRPVARVLLPHVGPDRVAQLEPCAAGVPTPVGQQHGGRAAPEETVGEEHGAVVAAVPVLRDILGRHDQRQRVALLVRPEQPAGQIDRDDRGGAAHAAQIEGQHVRPHAEAVDQHGRKRRGRAEERAVDDHDANVFGRRPRRLEQLLHGSAHHRLGLIARAAHIQGQPLGVLAVLAARWREDGRREDGGLRDARRLHDLLLELDRLLAEARLVERVAGQPRLFEEAIVHHRLARLGRRVAASDVLVAVRLEVDQVDRGRAAHVPHRQQPDGERDGHHRRRERAARQRGKVDERVAHGGQVLGVLGLARLAPRQVHRVAGEQQQRRAQQVLGQVARQEATHQVDSLRDPLVRDARPLGGLLECVVIRLRGGSRPRRVVRPGAQRRQGRPVASGEARHPCVLCRPPCAKGD